MKKGLNAFIERGTAYADSQDEKIRIRQVNLLNMLIIVLVSCLSLYIYFLNDPIWLMAPFIVPFMAYMVYLNQNGSYHAARFFSLLCIISGTYVVIYFAKTQIPAALGFIIIAFTGYFLLTKRVLKIVVTIIALLSYFIAEYYNLKFKPFDDLQYLPVIAFLVFAYISIIFIDSERERHMDTIQRQKSDLAEKNLEILTKNEEIHAEREKQLVLLKEKVALQNRELSQLAIKEVERNKLLESIQSNIEKISDSSGRLTTTKKLIKNALNADQSWDGFIQKFEAVYPHFFRKLNESFGHLTLNEKKLCGYLKVGMSNHEIEAVTHTASSTVKKNLNRLKKKLELSAEDSLRDFIHNV